MDNKSFFQLSEPLEVYWFLNWNIISNYCFGNDHCPVEANKLSSQDGRAEGQTDLSSEGEYNIIGSYKLQTL